MLKASRNWAFMLSGSFTSAILTFSVRNSDFILGKEAEDSKKRF